MSSTPLASAVFFDVDFTLIYPGPTFDGEGYHRFAARHGLAVDATRFGTAVAIASALLDNTRDAVYRPQRFVEYAGRVLTEMGGVGPGLEACAQEIYDQWAVCQHFALYDDVSETFERLYGLGVTIGLISNTHRCLASFQAHFELDRFVAVAVSSSDHGYMKPHPSIFEAALALAGVSPTESLMVGDSLTHDVLGARRAGMRGVLLARAGGASSDAPDFPTIRTLTELPAMLQSDVLL